MQALTANETTILKSRFQAGASGHSQKVVLTANVAASGGLIRNPYFPWTVRSPSGEAVMLYRADKNLSGAADMRIFFQRYLGQHVLADPLELFAYNTTAYGLVVWNGLLLAVCWNPTTFLLRYRTSADGGLTWTAEATLIAGATYAANELGEGGDHINGCAFQLTTSKDGLTLYVFSVTAWTLVPTMTRYRKTTSTDPTLGWTAIADTGFTIPSLGRNYGGPSARNQGCQRGVIFCESKTAGTWTVAAEADDGDWHANHMAAQGTIGGAWVRKLNAGYGGGLSGGQGANGGIFRDRNGELVFYVMSDDGDSVASSISTDSGSTWSATREEVAPAGVVPALGGGSGCAIPGYDSVEYLWGHVAGGGVALGVTHYGLPPDWIRIYGTGAAAPYVSFVQVSQDVSDRVISISIQKDAAAISASVSVVLRNNDGALNINDGAASLNKYAKANVKVEVWQWHGVVANSVKTFTGITDSATQDGVAQTVMLVGRDMAKKLVVTEVVPASPQGLLESGYVRDMSNFVYLNKTLAEVLTDLLAKSGTAFVLTVAPSTYVFRELRFQAGSLMDAAITAATMAGMRFWANEQGGFVASLAYGPQSASVWTYRAYEDVHEFGTDQSDDGVVTRVRVVGKANIGAKYLAEQFIWPSPSAGPRGIAYDATTGHVWVLCANLHLYRLNPAANMAIVTDTDLSAWLAYPDSIAVGPDNHLWIADGFDATLTANVNRKFRKVDRAAPGTTLVGPFTNPDQLHVRLWHDGTNLRTATYASPAALVVVNPATGAEVSRVTSPVNYPMGFDTDGQGGAFLTGWEQTDMYQISLAGSIVNTIKQPAKNSNEFGYDAGDLGLYAVFVEQNTIVKYAVAGAPSSVETATYYTAINSPLELEYAGEKRLLTIIDLSITDMAQAVSTAERILSAQSQEQKRLTVGVVGNPGLQLNDRVTLTLPGHGVPSSDWMVRSIRSDQVSGTYLMVLMLTAYAAAF